MDNDLENESAKDSVQRTVIEVLDSEKGEEEFLDDKLKNVDKSKDKSRRGSSNKHRSSWLPKFFSDVSRKINITAKVAVDNSRDVSRKLNIKTKGILKDSQSAMHKWWDKDIQDTPIGMKIEDAQDWWTDKKNEVDHLAYRKALSMTKYVVGPLIDKLGVGLKDLIRDCEMPQFILNGVDDLVANIVEDVKEEIYMELEHSLMEVVPDPRLHAEYKCCPLHETYFGLKAVRAWILYHKLPYDRSIWGSFRDRWWWLISIISVLPFWGIQQVWWLLYFIIIDKTDEYQLIDFVVSFKVAQCITLTFLVVLMGGMRLSYCLETSEFGKTNCYVAGQLHMEATHGEVLTFFGFWFDFVFFMSQIVLVFVACAYLPYTTPKGGRLYRKRGIKESRTWLNENGEVLTTEQIFYPSGVTKAPNNTENIDISKKTDDLNEDEESKVGSIHREVHLETFEEDKPGGSILLWVRYDIGCIVFILALCAVATFCGKGSILRDSFRDEGQYTLANNIFWIRTFYGYLMLPWILLKNPLMMMMLHVRATGYNRRGECVRTCGETDRMKIQRLRRERRERRSKGQSVRTDLELAKLMHHKVTARERRILQRKAKKARKTIHNLNDVQ